MCLKVKGYPAIFSKDLIFLQSANIYFLLT